MHYPKLVEARTSANEVTSLEWNPGMDLLATVFNGEALTCSRLLSFQKVWHKQTPGKIIAISWRPDGKALAIASRNEPTKKYVCSIHDVENGKKIYSIEKDTPINSIGWFQYVSPDDSEPTDIYNDLSACEPENETFSHQLARDLTQLNVLMIATDHGFIDLYALGMFFIGQVVINSNSSSKITKIHMSQCLSFMTATLSPKTHGHSSYVRIIKMETLNKGHKEFLKVSKMYARIDDELKYLSDTISAISTSWVDVLAGLDNKLSSYCSRKRGQDNDYTFLGADELLQLLVVGFTSDNLEKFLTDMSDKGLKKLNTAIEQTCLRVQNLIVKNAQKCCYHLHSDLNRLRMMSLRQFKEVSLENKATVDAMRSVGSLLLKLTELQEVIDHSLKSTKSFFRWLISIAFRMTGEQSNGSLVQNDLYKTTQQDIQLITDFILENFDYNQDPLDLIMSNDEDDSDEIIAKRPTCSNFKLEQVGQYLKDESLSRVKHSFAKSGSNFWIEFLKNKPELTEPNKYIGEGGSSVLLFYPHNPETSLIQEHSKTRQSIENAFNSLREGTNFGTYSSTKDDCIIDFKDLTRNVQTSRIRVETDMKLMHHYTLFQTRPEMAPKLYLLCQSLDSNTFKLISIEFQVKDIYMPSTSKSNSPPKSPLVVSDSGFYENKNSKKLYLAALIFDPSFEDTVIVHIEMSKILESRGVTYRQAKEVTKILRSNDSIDRHSSCITIVLDIYTIPPDKRTHSCELMVKKIKNTRGRDMFSSGGRGVLAMTSNGNRRLHLYELESSPIGNDIVDDEISFDEKTDESLIDTELQ